MEWTVTCPFGHCGKTMRPIKMLNGKYAYLCECGARTPVADNLTGAYKAATSHPSSGGNVPQTKQQLERMHKKTHIVRYDPITKTCSGMNALAARYRYDYDAPQGMTFWLREPDEDDLELSESETQTA